jgi:hypothetical protein
MRTKIGLVLVAILALISTVLPAYAEVESVAISPSLLVVGQPITFYGFVSRSSLGDQIGVYVYVGPNCPAEPTLASTYTVANSKTTTTMSNATGTYNVTLSFPIASSSGWVVEQQYRNGLPAGWYSVGVQDMTTEAILCRNFSITGQPTPEFSEPIIALILTLGASLYVLRRLNPSASGALT